MYNSISSVENNLSTVLISKSESASFINCNKKSYQPKLDTKSLNNSNELKILFDSLTETCKKSTNWTFNVDLISYKKNKSDFLSNLSQLQSYLTKYDFNIEEDDSIDNEILKSLCYYFIQLLCEADLLSITKNYSNKIISTLKVVPNSIRFIYSYLFDVFSPFCRHTRDIFQFDHDVKIKFCKIYTILSSDLINSLTRDNITNLLNNIISFYLNYYEFDTGVDAKQQEIDHPFSAEHFPEASCSQTHILEGIKCINLLLLNKSVKDYEINQPLLSELFIHLIKVLGRASTNYQLISSFSTCFVSTICYLTYPNDPNKLLNDITLDDVDYSTLTKEDSLLVKKVRSFPSLNYIYVIRSIIVYLHSTNNQPNDVFSQEAFNVLRNCFEIIRRNLLNDNQFVINYSLLQTVQSYTIFLGHQDKDSVNSSTPVEDSSDNLVTKNETIEANKSFYLESLIELSKILINYFSNKIKTISHLSIYIYKKLLQSLSTSLSLTPSDVDAVNGEINHYELQSSKRQMLLKSVIDSMKTNVSIKNKYIILDTIVKLICVERLLEYEPYLLLHLMINITNHKSVVTSLLSQLLSQIQSLFKRLSSSSCIIDKNLSNSMNNGPIQVKVEEIVLKCYLYPLLICIINDYRIFIDSADSSEFLMPTNTDSTKLDTYEIKRDRCDSINKVLMNIIPNYTFELLKLVNESHRFDYYEYLPNNYKEILNDRKIDLTNVITNLREFHSQIANNIMSQNKHLNNKHDESFYHPSLGRRAPSKDNIKPKFRAYNDQIEKLEWSRFEHILDLDGDLINDKPDELINNHRVVELHGKITYNESVCLYNFRRNNNLFFVNMRTDYRNYNGIIISNYSEKKAKDKNTSTNEVYYIDIKRFMFNLYYESDIEIKLNLIKSISDCKKISKLICSTEFMLIKFVLKHVIISINLSNQHYFTQLIYLFLQRLKYNYDSVSSDVCHSSLDSDLKGDNNSVRDYLLRNMKDIMKILSNNVNVYNNENKIIISLNIILFICKLFLRNKQSDDSDLIEDVLVRRLFNLFYTLKPINHNLVLNIFQFVSKTKVSGFMNNNYQGLVHILFNFNQNKYEIASNMLVLCILNNSDDKIRELLENVKDYYNNHFCIRVNGRLDVSKEESLKSVEGSLENLNISGTDVQKPGKRIIFDTLYEIILDYYNNINHYLYENVTVSGPINLLNSLLAYTDETCKNTLNKIYTLLSKLLKHTINEYMCPKTSSDQESEHSRLVDCRGYYINKSENEDKYEWNNVSTIHSSCNCTLYHYNNQNTHPIKSNPRRGLWAQNSLHDHYGVHDLGIKDNFIDGIGDSIDKVGGYNCKIGRRYEINNKNEFKLFNYLIYKMVHELVHTLQSMVYIFTEDVNKAAFWNKSVALHMLDELASLMMYCIINCRHVGCNDMFNNLLLFSLQKMLEFHQNNTFLHNYVYYLNDLILSSHQTLTRGSKQIENEVETDKNLLLNNVIDIHTRSEHLSLIFISIIKSESNKKTSDLNNKIILMLLDIIKVIEEDNVSTKQRTNPKIDPNHTTEARKPNGDKSLVVINVFNILRYIYRCIDMKYMNNENVLEVIRVCLKYMKSTNWSVKNSSSLLLSTVLSSLAFNQYLLNSGLLMSSCLFSELSSIIKNGSHEVLYYTLYVIQLMLNQSNLSTVAFVVKTDLLEAIQTLIGSENLYIRKLASSILSSYYIQTGNEIDQLNKLWNDFVVKSVDFNYVNGCLMLIMNLVTDAQIESLKNDQMLLEILVSLSKRITNAENYMLLREIIKSVGDEAMNFPELILIMDGSVEDWSTDKYHQSQMLEMNRSNLKQYSEQINPDGDNIYLLMKYFEKVTSGFELEPGVLTKLYKAIIRHKQYTGLFPFYFSIHNRAVSFLFLIQPDYSYNNSLDGSHGIKSDHKKIQLFNHLYGSKYYNLVNYCVNNGLISNNDLYIQLFKSLYYLFIITISSREHGLGDENDVVDKRKLHLLSTLGCLLANNINELEFNVRSELSSIYFDTFPFIRTSVSRFTDERAIQVFRKNLVFVFVNMLVLLQDDNINVRNDILNLIRFYLINNTLIKGVRNLPNDFSSDSILKEKHRDISYEYRLLEHIVNAFDISDTLSIFHSYLSIDLNIIDKVLNSKNSNEQLYEEEDNNMYREQMLIVKSILSIIMNFVTQTRFIKEVFLFLNKVIDSYQNCLKSVIHDEFTPIKLCKIGLKGSKIILTNIAILFFLLSIKIHLIAHKVYAQKGSPSNDLEWFKLSHGTIVNHIPSTHIDSLYYSLLDSFKESEDLKDISYERESLIFQNALISL